MYVQASLFHMSSLTHAFCLPPSPTCSLGSSLIYLSSFRSPSFFLGPFLSLIKQNSHRRSGRILRGRGSQQNWKLPDWPGTTDKACAPQFSPFLCFPALPKLTCESMYSELCKGNLCILRDIQNILGNAVWEGERVHTLELECLGSNPSPVAKLCSHGQVTIPLSASVFSFIQWE